jgi:hypothetical protein
MHPSERQHEKERRKRMRNQRKQYLADERASIRREKREFRNQKAKMRSRIRKARWEAFKDFWTNLFRKKEVIKTYKPADNPNAKQYLDYNWNVKLPHSTSDPKEEQQRVKEKKRQLRQQRKEFLADERRSRKREKQRLKQHRAEMRKKMNAARIEEVKREFKQFLKHPVKREEIDKSDKRILKKIKKEIRQQNLRNINRIPSLIGSSISRFWKNRFNWIKRLVTGFSSFARFAITTFSVSRLRNDHFKTLINSLVFFLLSFLLVYYVHQFATILAARAFNIPTKLYSYRIDWPLYTYSYLYTRKALIVIFGTGPLVSLLLGIGSYRLFLWARFRTAFLKYFALWTAFHSFNLFFGAYVVGVITRTGFVYTSEWLFLSNIFDVEEIVLMIVSIVVLLIAGYYSTRQFLLASNSAAIIEPKIRILYIFTFVFIPWLLGNLVLYMVNIPKNPVELVLLYSTSALMVIPVFSNYNTTTMQMLKLPHTPRKFRVAWAYLVLTLLVIFATRLLLQSGITFY